MKKPGSLLLVGSFAIAALVGSCGSVHEGRPELEPPRASESSPSDPAESATPMNPLSGLPVHDPTCSPAAPDVTVSNGWRSAAASQAAFDTLELVVIARPGAANLDGLVAIGAGELADFPDAAILVRFADDGFVDARDGSTYDKDIPFTYEAGVWYTIVISVSLTTRTYDVDVGRCGEPRQPLIRGAAFRSDAIVDDRLTTWGAWTSSATLELTTPTWVVSGTCAAATCESLAHVCGEPSNGCGGQLGCGSCGSDEVCVSGTCWGR